MMAENQAITSEQVSQEMARRSHAALLDRRARGEIMTYVVDDWVVREYPGQRIVRLCLLDEFDPADFPEPPHVK